MPGNMLWFSYIEHNTNGQQKLYAIIENKIQMINICIIENMLDFQENPYKSQWTYDLQEELQAQKET